MGSFCIFFDRFSPYFVAIEFRSRYIQICFNQWSSVIIEFLLEQLILLVIISSGDSSIHYVMSSCFKMK